MTPEELKKEGLYDEPFPWQLSKDHINRQENQFTEQDENFFKMMENEKFSMGYYDFVENHEDHTNGPRMIEEWMKKWENNA